MAQRLESVEDLRSKLARDRPSNLFDWLTENATDLSAIEVLYLVVDHVDRLQEKVNGIQEVNNLWDGS